MTVATRKRHTTLDWFAEERLAFKPPDRLTVSEWADRHIQLDKMTSAEPGPYRTRRTPYAREWMDSFATPGVEQVTLCTSTQVSKTTVQLNTLGYAIAQDPGPCLFVMPREEDAKRILANRIRPMVDASPELSQNLTGFASDWKTSGEVRFLRMVLYMGWAASPASLASNPCRYVWLDEVDKYPRFSGREADPVDLARERQHTFVGIRCLMLASTPTTREGRIWREFELSDQRRYWIPCPHCGLFQVLRWAQVRWPTEITDHRELVARDAAWYECEGCTQHITDGQKVRALERGVWVPRGGHVDTDGKVADAPEPSPHRGYHLWAGYSPWITWTQIASKFLQAQQSGDRSRLMNFVNSWLAELWEEELERPTAGSVEAAVVDELAEGTFPAEVKVLTAGVDVQKRNVYVTVWGWGADERVWLVYERRFGADLASLVDAVILGRFGPEGRVKLPVRIVAIDCRYRRDEVLALARAYPNVRACLGVERKDPQPFIVKRLDRHPVSGAAYKRALRVWHVNVGIFKDRIAHSMGVGPAPGKRYAFHVHRDPNPEFVASMGSEHKVLERARSGPAKERWVPKPGAAGNHFWDTSMLAWAAAEMIHVPLLTSARALQHSVRRARRQMLGAGIQ